MKLYKYRPLNDYTIDMVKSGTLWFSNLDSLNDPFEGDYYCPDPVITAHSHDEAFSSGPDLVTRVTRYLSEDRCVLRRQFYVLSMSRKHDDILMWSHYSDQHNGIVVEFEMPDIAEHLVDDTKWNIISSGGSILHNVDYSGEPVAYDPTGGNENLYGKVITRKTKQWTYEQEVRVIIHDKNARKTGVLVNTKPHIIKNVYFGMRCTPRAIDKAINNFDRTDLNFKRMYMRHGHFSLIAMGV